MGLCQSQLKVKQSIKPLTQQQTTIKFNTIKEQISFFDSISLEKLNQPDLQMLLSKYINKNAIVNEGKTWVAINEVCLVLKNKTMILIRNFNPETDAAIQLIYVHKQLVDISLNILDLQTTFNEETVELFHYFQTQLVQISIEVLLAINTLNGKQEQWWNDDYYKWRTNYIQSIFKIKQPQGDTLDQVNPIYQFMMLLKVCAKSFSNQQKSPDLCVVDIRAQQEILDQFYNQLRSGFRQNLSTQLESVNNEHQNTSKQLESRLQGYTLLINKKIC